MIIGLDVGGTHTDVALLDVNGLVHKAKVATDSDNLLWSVQSGLQEVLSRVKPGDLKRVVLSTTLTTNAIAEQKLAEVGMIVSSGPGIDPEFYRTNNNYYVVSGSIDHRGREIQPIKPSEIEAVASRMRKQGIQHVGVVGKFSTRNPSHEIQIREILGKAFDYIILGHTVSGNLNFPRRIATAYLNAAVYPIHKQFFEAVCQSLERQGLDIPIYVLKADGGTMSVEASLNYPGQSILSGPAASVIGCIPYASRKRESLVLDIGGTTTDMAVLIQGTPLLNPLGIELGGYKTLIRALDSRSLALGGDSTVRCVDGQITLGPDRQGPAMAYGGPVPTPTDALMILGWDGGGNVEASHRGFEPIAEGMGLSLQETAQRVFDQACARMLEEAVRMIERINSKPVYTVHELLEGYQVNPREILVIGGPAEHFAKRLTELSSFQARVIPEWQIANAVGAALARTTSELTLFVDTQRGVATAPEEGFHQPIKGDFTKEKALDLAKRLLLEKAIRQGAEPDDLEIELLELLQFNMVRSFYTTGRNIRVKVQVKPGLLNRYRLITEQLAASSPHLTKRPAYRGDS